MPKFQVSAFAEPHSHAQPTTRTRDVPPEARAIVAFWRAAGPDLWFAKDRAFDMAFRDRFLTRHEACVAGHLTEWAASAEGAMALVLLVDQFPRNAFRGTSRMFATDDMARAIATDALWAGHDRVIDPALRMFFYLPFAHSEDIADQNRSVTLFRDLPPPAPDHAARHRDIIHHFGRFPHRNAILGRRTTPQEAEYLNSGGYAG